MQPALASTTLPAKLLPWLGPVWQRLLQAHRSGRFGQALLITGPGGIGKLSLVEELTRLLLCGSPTADGLACGECTDCSLVDAGHHPDLVRLEPEAEGASSEIRAEQVRQVCRAETLTPTRGATKVLQIRPAEAMNQFAANSLLKTLEEPVASSVWLLVSEQPQRLPQTIRSRCQRIDLGLPAERDALPWLKERLALEAPQQVGDAELCLRLAHGAPLRALGLASQDELRVRGELLGGLLDIADAARDPVALANDWQRLEASAVLAVMIDCMADLLSLVAVPDGGGRRLTNVDALPRLASLARRLDPAAGHRFLRRLLQTRGSIDAPINKQLMLEALLVRWALLFDPRT